MALVKYFTGTTGFNNVDDPTSVQYDPETGVSDLIEGVNVNISPPGCISRTDGYELLHSGNFHSLFCDKGDAFVGSGTNIYSINKDWSLTFVRTGMSGRRISFFQLKDDTFYTDGINQGIIRNKQALPWYVNDISLQRGPNVLMPFPVCRKLSFFHGRVYGLLDDMVVWSELYLPGLWAPTTNHARFASRVLMIKPVAAKVYAHLRAGIFASDEQATWLMMGEDPHNFELIKVADYPAYEWSDATDYVEGTEIGCQDAGPMALWNSPEGVCAGSASGTFYNLTKKKIVYPQDGRFGACGLRGYTLYNSII